MLVLLSPYSSALSSLSENIIVGPRKNRFFFIKSGNTLKLKIIKYNTSETTWIEQSKKAIYFTNEQHSSLKGHITGLENVSQSNPQNTFFHFGPHLLLSVTFFDINRNMQGKMAKFSFYALESRTTTIYVLASAAELHFLGLFRDTSLVAYGLMARWP